MRQGFKSQLSLTLRRSSLNMGLLHRFCVAGVLMMAAVVVAHPPARQDQTDDKVVPLVRVLSRDTITGPQGKPFTMPTDAAVGSQGYLYVLDGVNNRVVVYDPEGRFCFQFGSEGSKLGQFLSPLGIATGPDGKVYVADSGNHRVQVFESDGKPQEAVALPVGPDNVTPDPTDVAVDPTKARLFIVDNENHRINVYNLNDRVFEGIFGGPGKGDRQFRFPFLMDVSSQGYLFIAEPINTRIQVLNPNGKFVCFIGAWGIKPGQLFRPKGVAILKNRVFISDSYLGRIQVFDPQGKFMGMLADAAGVPMQFITPTGVTVDEKNNYLYIVELKANRVSRVSLE